MANVVGEEVSLVSDQLTAVWNNFYDGTKSLEYYADVMTALGAATASSTDEIAEGLEKFAAIASAVGLSYEYATAALATVTATTRQSADVVGTAYKTLFARIQGLTLGETLEDGTNLNKYSKAMQQVGIDIKDQNGELKDMDDILDELGNKWQTLSKDQRIAFAETVAGVRQYTQLVALMDNWDFFQENLATARGAEGTLNEQAEIYAESWEAARDRVKAAAEGVFDSIINPDLYITADKGLTNVLGVVEDLIDGIGGLKGILLLAGHAMLQLYGDKVAQGLRGVAENISIMTGIEGKRARALQQQAVDLSKNLSITYESNKLESEKLNLMQKQVTIQGLINQSAEKFDADQMAAINVTQQLIDFQKNQVLDTLNRLTTLQSTLNTTDEHIYQQLSNEIGQKAQDIQRITQSLQNKGITLSIDTNFYDVEEAFTKIKLEIQNVAKEKAQLTQVANALNQLADTGRGTAEEIAQVAANFDGIELTSNNVTDALIEVTDQTNNCEAKFKALRNMLRALGANNDDITSFIDTCREIASSELDAAQQSEALDQALRDFIQNLQAEGTATQDWADIIVNASNELMKMSMMLNSIQSLGSIFSDEDLSSSEKFVQSISAISMLLPGVASSFQAIIPVIKAYRATVAASAATEAEVASVRLQAQRLGIILTEREISLAPSVVAARRAETQAQLELNAAMNASKMTIFMLAIMALAGAFMFLKKRMDDLGLTVEGAQKRISKANEAYEEQKQKVEELNSELEQTRQRIEELNSQDTLSLVEQEELDRLKAREDLLERQLVIQERLAKIEAEKAAREYQEYANTAYQFNDNGVYKDQRTREVTTIEEKEKELDERQKKIQKDKDAYDKEYAEYQANKGSYNSAQIEYKDDYFEDWKNSINAETEALNEDTAAWKENFEARKQIASENLLEREDARNAMVSSQFAAGYSDEEIFDIIDQYWKSDTHKGDISGYRSASGGYAGYVQDYITPLLESDTLKEYSNLFYNHKDELQNTEKSAYAILKSLNLSDAEIKSILIYMYQAGISLADLGSVMDETYQRASDNLQAVNFPEWSKFLASLDSTELQIVASINMDGIETWEEFYKQYLQATSEERTISIDLEGANKSVLDAFSTLASGEVLSDEQLSNLQQKFEGIYDLSNLENLSAYDQARMLREAWLVASNPEEFILGTQKRINALEDEREELKKLRDDGKITEDEFEKREIEINFDIENALDQLDSLNDFELDPLSIEFEQGAIDSLVAQMTPLKKAASLIGEGFKVNPENVQELARTLPQLFKDATVDMKTGVVQLNKDTVNEVTKTANAEVDATKSALINDLTNRKIHLGGVIDLLQSQRDIAIAYSGQTVSAEQADEFRKLDNKKEVIKAILMAKFHQAIQEQSQSAGTAASAIHFENEIANASKESGITTAENWTEAFKQVAEKAKGYLSNVVGYQTQAAGGKEPTDTNYISASLSTAGFNTGKYQMSYRVDFDPNEMFGAAMNYVAHDFNPYYLQDEENRQSPYASQMQDEAAKIAAGQFRTVGYNIGEQSILAGGEAFENAFISTYIGKDWSTLITDIDAAINDKQYELADTISKQSQLASGIDGAIQALLDSGKSKGKSGSNKQQIKELEELNNKYHDITREIEYQEQVLDRLDKQINRTFGLKKIDLFKQSLQELSKQAALETEKSGYANEFVKLGARNLLGLGLSIEVDPDSLNISNYEEVALAAWQQYKDFLDKYNVMSAEEQEKNKERLEQEEELYNQRLEALEEYEKDVDTYWEQDEKRREALMKLEDTKLQEATQRLAVILDVKNLEDAADEFSKTIVESFENDFDRYIKSGDISQKMAQAEINLVPEYQQQFDNLKTLLDNANEYTNTEDIVDQLEELQSKVISSGEALLDWIDTIEDLLPNALDDAREKFSLFTDQLEHNKTVLDTMKELITLQSIVNRSEHNYNRYYNTLQKATRENLEASKANAELQKQWFENARRELLEAENALAGVSVDDVRYDTLKGNRDALLAEYNEAQEAMLSSAQEAMERARDIFTLALEKASYDFGRAMTSDDYGLALLQTKYDHLIEAEERYLDEVNEAYEVTQWNAKLQKSIDEASSSAAAAKLKALQDEIELRRENNTLSQYDLDILNAKYEALLAEIALEEAQNNKSQVRLTRDNQGNWSYQYTADQAAIDDAEGDLADARNEWYNIAKDQTKEITDEIIAAWQEANDKIKEIYEDESMTVAEREAAIVEIRQFYADKIKFLEQEKNIAIKDMTEAGGAVIKEFGNTYQDVFDLMQNGTENFEDAFDQACKDMEDAFEEYGQTITDVAQESGTNLSDLQDYIDKVSDSTDNCREAGEEAVDYMWDSIDAIHAQSQAYIEMAESIMEAVRALEALARQTAQEVANVGGVGPKLDSNGEKDYSYAMAEEYRKNGLTERVFELAAQREVKTGGEYGNYLSTNEILDILKKADADNPRADQYIDEILQGKHGFTKGSVSFDTGGYTGEFDNTKLAFLHEKELVLDQQDTENILSTVSAVRSIGPALFKSIENILDSRITAGMSSAFSFIPSIDTTTTDLNQNVYITAEFPTADNQNEIREAILGLANYATQFVNKR